MITIALVAKTGSWFPLIKLFYRLCKKDDSERGGPGYSVAISNRLFKVIKHQSKQPSRVLEFNNDGEMTGFFWLKRVLDWGPEHRESKMTVLCPLIIIILTSYIIIYYIIIKLLIMENHPSWNRKWSPEMTVVYWSLK